MISPPTIRNLAVNHGPKVAARTGTGPASVIDKSLPSRLRPVAVLLLLVGAIALDGGFAPAVGWATLLAAASAAAATFAGPVLTGGVVLISGAAKIGLDLSYTRIVFAAAPQPVAKLVICEIVIVLCALWERHRMELTAVRAVSEIAQRVVLRPLPCRLGPLRIAAAYQASDAHATVGGDLYAATRIPGATRILIGDVRGKGLQGIHEVAATLGAFREAARCRITLPEVAAHLDGSIHSHLEEIAGTGHDAAERFVTALVLEIPDDRSVVHTVSCGHPAPLLSSGGRVTLLEPQRSSPPLGLGSLASHDYHQDTFPFTAHDILMLYTDGITEARDKAGAFYPLKERFASWTGTDPEELLQHVQDDVCRHIDGPLGDDAALIALQRTPDGQGAYRRL